jgi:hypothetical protein
MTSGSIAPGAGEGQEPAEASVTDVAKVEHRAPGISIAASRASRSSPNAGEVRIHYAGRRRGPPARRQAPSSN